MKRKIILVFSLISLVTLTACNKDTPDEESSLGLERYITETPEDIPPDELTPDDVATNYINALVDGDMDAAYALVDVSDATFFTVEDFEYVVKRSDLSWIIDNKTITPGTVSVAVTRGTAEANTYFIQSAGNYEYIYFNLNLDKNNTWKVSSSGYVMSDVTIKAPVGTRLFLGDCEVKSDYLKRSANYYDYYELPCVARMDWETHVVSSLFGDAVGELTVPDYDPNNQQIEENREFEVDSSVSSQLFNELKQDIITMYTGIYNSIESGSDISSIEQFISPNINIDAFRPMFETAQKNVKSRSITNIRLVNISSLSEYPSFINSESEVVVNMGMELNWYETTGIKSTRLITAIRLEQVNGKWYLTEAYPNAWSDFVPNLEEYSDTFLESKNKEVD